MLRWPHVGERNGSRCSLSRFVRPFGSDDQQVTHTNFYLQMRIRNLTQVLAYNLVSDCTERPVFFYTLHLTSKSAPFFTSDQATGLNPRWMEIDFKENSGLSSSCQFFVYIIFFESGRYGEYIVLAGFVIRIWQAGVPDKLVTTWGVCLSGLQLAPLDQDLSRTVTPNNLVFFLQGLRFVPPVQDQSIERLPSALVNSIDTKNSYPVNQLRRFELYFCRVIGTIFF